MGDGRSAGKNRRVDVHRVRLHLDNFGRNSPPWCLLHSKAAWLRPTLLLGDWHLQHSFPQMVVRKWCPSVGCCRTRKMDVPGVCDWPHGLDHLGDRRLAREDPVKHEVQGWQGCQSPDSCFPTSALPRICAFSYGARFRWSMQEIVDQ
jgi:hypothetical protein